MNGLTVYAQLLSRATDGAKEQVARELHGHLVAVERDISQAMVEMLRHVYMEGVRDGFHEGLAAAEEQTQSKGEHLAESRAEERHKEDKERGR